ncbi:hypothetical protein [Maridesulfovibrio bastinii]|uniref:hypothetical protein n=1 Tax=Maridesulfovibrio bastinii TaxID=47157 RepID=UPI001FDFCBB5|nr:hypothetical protein [Maridesulfovibrio bastinii]
MARLTRVRHISSDSLCNRRNPRLSACLPRYCLSHLSGLNWSRSQRMAVRVSSRVAAPPSQSAESIPGVRPWISGQRKH